MKFDKFLSKVRELTASNRHTEARIAIATRYEFLSVHRAELRAIHALQSRMDGYSPLRLMDYRKAVVDDMFETIRRIMGEEIRKQIYNCL